MTINCEQCGDDCSDDCFIIPDGTVLCPACIQMMDAVDRQSKAAMRTATTREAKVSAWLEANNDILREGCKDDG